MATSGIRHTSRLRREMSRDLDQFNLSIASSTGSCHGTVSTDSTMTDFDPEKDDAIMSTRQLNDEYSQKLPEIRNTAKKYGRWSPRRPDFVINTSAIGRAFPDFSQGGSSDDSMSIELPRGPKSKQQPSAKNEPLTDYSDNIASSPFLNVGSAQVINTPKRGQAQESVLKEALRNSTKHITPRNDSQKENVPPISQKSDSPYVSRASRTTSGERKTLAELHARVADDPDGSFMGEERPATVTLQSKNTRFYNPNSKVHRNVSTSNKQQDHTIPTEQYAPSPAGAKAEPIIPPNTMANVNSTPNPTTQSFILPNIPEVSLNVTPLLKGVPVVARGGRVHSQARSGSIKGYPHEPIDGIVVPDEEEDIYQSLEAMRLRVAKLETEKATAKIAMDRLQDTIRQLLAEKEDLRVKNEDLEHENRTLREHISQFVMDADAAERNFTKDITQSTHDTELLKKENQMLKSQIKELSVAQQRKQAIDRMRQLVREHQKNNTIIESVTTLHPSSQIKQGTAKADPNNQTYDADTTSDTTIHQDIGVTEPDGDSLGSFDIPTPDRSAFVELRDAVRQSRVIVRNVLEQTRNDTKTIHTPASAGDQNAKSNIRTEQPAQRTKGLPGILKNATQNLDDFTGQYSSKSARSQGIEEDLTTRSAASKQEAPLPGEQLSKRSGQSHGLEEDLTTGSAVSKLEAPLPRRHSSTKRIKSRGIEEDLTTGSAASNSEMPLPRRHSDPHGENRIRRSRREIDDMTSAFIIPDISINAPNETANPTLTAAARQILDGLCEHDRKNCSICLRIASAKTKATAKQTTFVSKPIPVSERMPIAEPYGDEPTLRPSVPPGLALATVIKGLEDEVEHLKADRARVQAAYDKHDASLAKRQRKALKRHIDECMSQIERKMDQLYSLYDVLEGLKQSGREMTEDEVEITLTGLGIIV